VFARRNEDDEGGQNRNDSSWDEKRKKRKCVNKERFWEGQPTYPKRDGLGKKNEDRNLGEKKEKRVKKKLLKRVARCERSWQRGKTKKVRLKDLILL